MTIRRLRFAGWISKAKNTHLEYIIPLAFSLEQWLCKRSSMLRYTYTVCIFLREEAEGNQILCSVAKVLTSKRHSNKTVSKTQPLHANFNKHSDSPTSDCKTQALKRK